MVHHTGAANTFATDDASDTPRPSSPQAIIKLCVRNRKEFHFVIHQLISRKKSNIIHEAKPEKSL